MARIEVRAAQAAERESVIATLTLAFSVDPPTRWLFPTAREFLSTFPIFAAAFGARAFIEGTAYVANDGAAAALWLPPGVEPDREALGAVIGAAMAARERGPDREMGEEMARLHPQEPHWYLPLIGVDPAHQGKGLGSALLKHALARCDAEGRAAYLESSNIKNVPLYERHGFEVLRVIQSGDFPPLYPMSRPARR
jgi:ribosomal protein S18 acetylase RimI-like enzyme